jgi:hypothetical protein
LAALAGQSDTFRWGWNKIIGRNLNCKLWAFPGLPKQLDEPDCHLKRTAGNYPFFRQAWPIGVIMQGRAQHCPQ